MIWIRADAGKEIGTGHVMRCLSVALEAAGAGETVCFLVADEASADFLATKGVLPETGNPFSKTLGTDPRDMEAEPELLERLLANAPGPILVDSYFVTPEYLRRLGEMTFVSYMDDEHRFPNPAGRIINYNLYAQSMDYGKDPKEREARLLLGPGFAPLRAQFRDVPYQVRSEVKKILLTTGGSDPYNLSTRILETLLGSERWRETEFLVVSGAMNPHYGELCKLAERDLRVRLYSNVSDMAGLMAACDLAIAAGGSTLYELCAVGTPFLCFSFAENQERAVKSFAEAGLTAFGGDYLRQGQEMIPALSAALSALADRPGERARFSAAQRALVDSRGAARIAEELMTWTR